MKQYLFVYGTLKPGHAPPEIAATVERLRDLGEGFVFGRLYDLGSYPAGVLDQRASGAKIFGRIYELPPDESVLRELDEYENFDPENAAKSLYRREKVKAFLNNRALTCWIYQYKGDPGAYPLIESGRFEPARTA